MSITKLILAFGLLMFPIIIFGQFAAPFQKSSKWSIRQIKVGFENPSPSNELQRNWTKEAILATWGTICQIDFIGWGDCSDNSCNLRVLISNDNSTRPYALKLGYLNNKLPNALVLNTNWYNLGCGDLSYKMEECFKAVAVHEFGHALGFTHEHANGKCCQPQGDNGGSDIIDPRSDDWIINPVCDEESVMSYCNKFYGNHGKLSPTDISIVQQVYGKRVINDNVVIASDNFSNNSSFENYIVPNYRAAYKTDNNTYRLHLASGGDGFTFSPFSQTIANGFSAYPNTTLEFDFKPFPIGDQTYAFGLMFDLHDVYNDASFPCCRGGNFYVMTIFCDPKDKTTYAGVKRRSDCQNCKAFEEPLIGYKSEVAMNPNLNHIKLEKTSDSFNVFINQKLSCSFSYNAYLNFQSFLYSPGDCEISNLVLSKK